MRVGFNLPNIGPMSGPESIVKVARRAEELHYDSLWVIERLLYPVAPQDPYPATPDGHLPEEYKHVLDPLEALTFAAAHTSRIALGTSDRRMSAPQLADRAPVRAAGASYSRLCSSCMMRIISAMS